MIQQGPGGDPAEPDVEIELEEIAEEFLHRLQAGEVPDKRAFMSAHPEISELVEQHLAVVEMLHHARLP